MRENGSLQSLDVALGIGNSNDVLPLLGVDTKSSEQLGVPPADRPVFRRDRNRVRNVSVAIDDARERCQFAAQQLDMTCGQIKSLNLQSSGGGPIMMRMQDASATADTVSQVGPREISATVQATFAMK